MSAADIEAVKAHIIETEKLKAQLRDDPDFAARFREEFLAQLSKTKAEQEKNAVDIKAFNVRMANVPASDLQNFYQQDRYTEYHTTPNEEPKKPTPVKEPKNRTHSAFAYPEMHENFTI